MKDQSMFCPLVGVKKNQAACGIKCLAQGHFCKKARPSAKKLISQATRKCFSLVSTWMEQLIPIWQFALITGN